MSPPFVSSPGKPMPPMWATFSRFLEYLWPRDAPALRRRVVVSLMLVLLGKGIGLVMPFAYKATVDRMMPGMQGAADVTIALAASYALARFGSVISDNLRNIVFERVGQDATRRLAERVFAHGDAHRRQRLLHLVLTAGVRHSLSPPAGRPTAPSPARARRWCAAASRAPSCGVRSRRVASPAGIMKPATIPPPGRC